MFRKSNLFVLFVLSVLLGTAGYAQETIVVPATPSQPQRIERQMQIFTNGGGSYLGVQLQEVSKENFSKFGLKDVRGAAVEKVSENSPAKQAGFLDGDVIVKFEGEEISSVRKLQRLIGEVAPDHQAKVTVLRGGNERDLTVTMGKRPAPSFQGGNFNIEQMRVPGIPEFPSNTMPRVTMPPPEGNFEFFRTMPDSQGGNNMVWNFFSGRRIGVNSMALTKQLGDYFGVADGKGVLISNVSENSPAAKAGLKAGDVIIEAEGKAISTTAELSRALGDKQKKTVSLTVLRNKNRQNITVEPEESKDVFETAPAVRMTAPRGAVTNIMPRVMTLSGTSSIEL